MRRDELALPNPPSNDRPGDRWMCGLANGESPCSRGPGHGGVCPLATSCRPRRTWKGQTRRLRTSVLLGLIAIVTFMVASQGRARLFKPGDLAQPHAQILSGTHLSDRCSSCHPQAATSPLAWFSSSVAQHADVRQTDLCLDCHHTTISRSRAKLAHNLPRSIRNELSVSLVSGGDHSWHDRLPSAAVHQDNIECAACHREHRGSEADLTSITDAQCQSCHSDRFGSFASSHPRWQEWPYGRGGSVSFNHASHANRHFPSTKSGSSATTFDCSGCHQRTASNELTRSVSYDSACRSCHDEALRARTAGGFDLLALPTLPTESADRLAPWPEAATGPYEGRVTPLAHLLLRSDPKSKAALGRQPEIGFAGYDASDEREVADAENLASGHRRLMQELANRGHRVSIERVLASGIAPKTIDPMLRTLPPQLIDHALQKWFQRTDAIDPALPPTPGEAPKRNGEPMSSPAETSATDGLHGDEMSPGDMLLGPTDLLGDDDLLGKSLTSDPLAIGDVSKESDDQVSSRFEADEMLPAGGWYRDDIRLAIRYRGGGHEDSVLRSLVETISQLAPSDPTRRRLLQNQAVAACVDCHPGALEASGNWRSDPLIGMRGQFTRFAHAPHLNVAQLADCTHCHRVAGGSSTDAEFQALQHTLHQEFEPISRDACAACHTSQAAGDSCTTCHQYHVGANSLHDLRR